MNEEHYLRALLEALDEVLQYSITCCSGLDDDEFHPKLDTLLKLHREYKETTQTPNPEPVWPTTLDELLAILDSGATVTHRGYPVTALEPLWGGHPRAATRWEGSAGYHIRTMDLPFLIIKPNPES